MPITLKPVLHIWTGSFLFSSMTSNDPSRNLYCTCIYASVFFLGKIIQISKLRKETSAEESMCMACGLDETCKWWDFVVVGSSLTAKHHLIYSCIESLSMEPNNQWLWSAAWGSVSHRAFFKLLSIKFTLNKKENQRSFKYTVS